MSERRPLFIVGCYRSGTSLLRLMMSSHSRVHIPAETRYIPYIASNVEALGDLSDREQLSALVDRIRGYLRAEGWRSLPTVEYIEATCVKRRLGEIVESISLIDCPSEKRRGVCYWGDKTPVYVMSIPLIAKMFPGARFVNVIRDGRDVFASVKRLHLGGARNAAGAALEWNERVTAGLLGQALLGKERVFDVKYEELVANPGESVARVCRFLDLEFEPQMLRYYESDQARELAEQSHHKKVSGPPTADSIGRYRERLSAREIKKFEAYTYNALVALGYEPDYPCVPPPSNMRRYLSLAGNAFQLSLMRLIEMIGVR